MPFTRSTLPAGFLNMPDQFRYDGSGNVILYGKDIFKPTVIVFCPDTTATPGFTQLDIDTNTLTSLSNRSLDEIVGRQFVRQAGYIQRFSAMQKR